MHTKKLENKLIDIGYPGLFMHGENGDTDAIWNGGENLKQLESIILSASSTPLAKFLAAEILRYFDIESDRLDDVVLAEAYVFALENTAEDKNKTVGLNGNLWGLLYEEDDVGYLGQQFVKFGDAAVSPLTKLLDDDAGRVFYDGSEEATIGNAYQYRIKDFAAFFISKIKNIPVEYFQDFERRDKEIERLKGLLKERK